MWGTFTKVQNIKSLYPGDHVAIWDYSRWPLSYQHHGIIWKSGDTPQNIQVVHVWSPLEAYREAQADSCFRISTLEEFLFKRSINNLRVVEYHTSAFRDLLSKWGEVHLVKSDLPQVVLARCEFLLGLGKGEFNIFTQNCEHAAHWCMTGEQWCKQNLTTARGKVPFEKQTTEEQILLLENKINQIKESSIRIVENILNMKDSNVYLRVNNTHYVRIININNHPNQIQIVDNIKDGSLFRLNCYTKGYNCVKVSFFSIKTNKYMYSRSTFSCFRDIRMKKYNYLRGKDGMTWEFSSNGLLKSMNQHRRYVGIRSHDNVLIDVSIRGDAAKFEMIPADQTMINKNEIKCSFIDKKTENNINHLNHSIHNDTNTIIIKENMNHLENTDKIPISSESINISLAIDTIENNVK